MSASQHPAVAAADVEEDWSHPRLGRRRWTHARARVRALEIPKLETVEEREDYIEALMVEGIWSDETTAECQWFCAKAWGVAESTIRNYSAGASRRYHGKAREEGGWRAARALRALTEVAENGASSPIPGDKNAAVAASKELLKFAGLAEPEEDKQRPTTLVQVGQVVASPVFGALLNGSLQPKLNGTHNGSSQTDGTAEGAEVVSGEPGDGTVVRDPRKRD
jgi:hypothetical protein